MGKSVNVFAGGGVSFYLANPGDPADLKSQVSQTHPIGTLRVMWYPDHLLRIGLETVSQISIHIKSVIRFRAVLLYRQNRYCLYFLRPLQTH